MVKKTVLFIVAFVILLSLPDTARADGLPGEYLLSQRWRELFGRHSPITNPALLTEENYPTVRFAIAPVLQGAFKLGEAGFTYPLGMYQSLGLSMLGEDGGTIDGGMFDSQSGELRPSNSTSSNQNGFLIMTYAINPWRRFSVGANLSLAYQSNFGDPVMGVGLDLGVSYRLLLHPVAGCHIVGLSIQNLFSPSMAGEAGQLIDPKSQAKYSKDLKLSWVGSFLEDRVESGLDMHIKDIFASKDEFTKIDPDNPASFLEGPKKIEWAMSMYAGGWLLRMIKVYLQMGFDKKFLEYWGLSGGVNLPTINNGRDFCLLYQYNVKTEATIASSHTIYFHAEVGKSREERFAKRVAVMMSLEPNELYNKAMKLYSEGQYWDAFFVFSQIKSRFPDFFKNDWVCYYRGSCLEKLDMRQKASELYRATITDYKKSEVVPHAELGIMRICYREEDHNCVRTQFNLIIDAQTTDSLRYHAYYLMGESYMQQGQTQNAIKAFELIPPGHPEYVFAQHTLGIAKLETFAVDDAIESFENAIQDVVTTKAQNEMVNRSLLFLGYLYYEQVSFSKAVVVLREVPSNSMYYEDALIGLGWTALKSRQWSDCKEAARLLQKHSADPTLTLEADLLTAYCFMVTKDFVSAADVLEMATNKIDTIVVPNEETLIAKKLDYHEERIKYNNLSRDAEKISLEWQAENTLKVIDSMHTVQVGIKKKIDHFLDYKYHFGRRTFFARNYKQVKDDIEYAYVVVKRLIDKISVEEIQQKAVDKSKKITDEIEELKRQMETLEKEEE